MIEFGQYYLDLNLLTVALVKNPLAVYLAAALILIAAFLLYQFWFKAPVARLVGALDVLTQAIQKDPSDWVAARLRVRGVVKRHPMLAVAWMETEERVIELPDAGRPAHVMFGSPRDLWSPTQLLARQINLPLAESVPNLLVGFGLLLTFFFLALALTEATSALGAQANAQADLLQATHGLLGAAGAKFLTSLTGLLASIAWTIASKKRLAGLSRASEEILAALAVVAPVGGGELAMLRQVQIATEGVELSRRVLESIQEQHGSFKNYEMGATALAEEMLEELREQHGTLKRFETDLAVSLANAINPQMEAMTTQLVAAIENLSRQMGTMNQQALQQMMQEFSGMLKQATESEMTQLRQQLEALANNLNGAGQAIGAGVADAAEKIGLAGQDLVTHVGQIGQDLAAQVNAASGNLVTQVNAVTDNLATKVSRAGEDLATRIDAVSGNLVTQVGQVADSLAASATHLEGATGKLEEATSNVKVAMDDLDVSIQDAADLGKKGGNIFDQAIDQARGVVVSLGSVAGGLTQTSTTLVKASDEIGQVARQVETLSREQQAVVNAVRDVAPAALAAVEKVTRVLDQAAAQATQSAEAARISMETGKKSMEATSKSLTETVAAITQGVTTYTHGVVELHQKMDGSLAKAVGNFDKGIEGLDEAISELGEIMESAIAGRP